MDGFIAEGIITEDIIAGGIITGDVMTGVIIAGVFIAGDILTKVINDRWQSAHFGCNETRVHRASTRKLINQFFTFVENSSFYPN